MVGLSSCDQQAQLNFSLNPSTAPSTTQGTTIPKEEASRPVPQQSANSRVVTASTYYAGSASGGHSINVDLNSISRVDYPDVEFVYYLGKERVQSQATQNMRKLSVEMEPKVQLPKPEQRSFLIHHLMLEQLPMVPFSA